MSMSPETLERKRWLRLLIDVPPLPVEKGVERYNWTRTVITGGIGVALCALGAAVFITLGAAGESLINNISSGVSPDQLLSLATADAASFMYRYPRLKPWYFKTHYKVSLS